MSKNIRKNQYETCVKPLRSEFISLVTSESVKQYYDEQDFNSQKIEQSKIFKNKPPPPHHYRYLPNNVKSKKKKNKDTKIFGFVLSSEDKRLASYFLIYIIVFICSITLLYLFYTPKNMNLFGFYYDKDLKLKFYQYVRKKPINTTSKIIIPIEKPKIYTTQKINISFTTEKTESFTESLSTSTTTEPTKTTIIPKNIQKISSTTENYIENDLTKTTSLSINENLDLVSSKKHFTIKTTCIPVNITDSIETDDKISYTTPSYLDKISKNSTDKEIDSNFQTTTEINLIKKESSTAKDNTTETIEFQEKISYSKNSHVLKVEKNETSEDETLVDNGIIPTEEEEEEKRKDELESKLKIASFFGLDDQIKLKNKLSSEKNKLTTQVENYKALLEEEFRQKNEKNKKPDKWQIKFKEQKSNNEFYFDNKNENKNDEDLKYQPMLRLILGNCNGGCSKF